MGTTHLARGTDKEAMNNLIQENSALEDAVYWQDKSS